MSKEIAETPIIYRSEIGRIPEFTENELNTICICREGCARSWVAADSLNELGFKAKFIEGGIVEIFAKHLRGENITYTLSKVPNLVIILEEMEMIRFTNMIKEMELIRQRQCGVTIITDSINVKNFVGKLLNQPLVH